MLVVRRALPTHCVVVELLVWRHHRPVAHARASAISFDGATNPTHMGHCAAQKGYRCWLRTAKWCDTKNRHMGKLAYRRRPTRTHNGTRTKPLWRAMRIPTCGAATRCHTVAPPTLPNAVRGNSANATATPLRVAKASKQLIAGPLAHPRTARLWRRIARLAMPPAGALSCARASVARPCARRGHDGDRWGEGGAARRA